MTVAYTGGWAGEAHRPLSSRRHAAIPHQAASSAVAERERRASANPRLPPQPGFWLDDPRRNCGGLVAVPYQSQVDLPPRLVAPVSPSRTAARVEFCESIAFGRFVLGPTGSGKTALSLATRGTLQRRNRQLRLRGRLSRHGSRHGQAIDTGARPHSPSSDRRRRSRSAIHRGRLQPRRPRHPATKSPPAAVFPL